MRVPSGIVAPVAVCALILALLMLSLRHIRFNWTASMPRGVYRVTAATPKRGDLVAFCLESPEWTALARERGYLDPGSCPSGLRHLLKSLAGMPGDVVKSKPDGIQFVPASGISVFWPVRHEDSVGRPLPESSLQSGVIPDGMGLVLSGHPGSFDSRFYGLVPLVGMVRVEPVFTF